MNVKTQHATPHQSLRTGASKPNTRKAITQSQSPLKDGSDEGFNLTRSEISKTIVTTRLVIASAAVTEKSAHFETHTPHHKPLFFSSTTA